ncbi:ATP-dependent Clp protease ATP-binding subunit [Patescibacteria group bacterium]|nr:ATP-dependent Clp protease ATP-binding subunit [Patescibacteria group bacterium]
MLYYDLKLEASKKTIGNVVARDVELRRIARTLKRQYNSNILVRGASGIGKSALLEALAYQIASGQIKGFENATIVKLDSANLKKLFAQMTNPAATADAIAYFQNAFISMPHGTIVVIDDFESVVPEHKFSEVNQALQPFFEANNLRLCIAINDLSAQKMREENPAFFQHFEEIALREPDNAETKQILSALSPAFEKEYGIKIPQTALAAAAEMSVKAGGGKKMPLAAIHFLDEALAFAKISGARELEKKHAQEIFSEKTGIPGASMDAADVSLLKNLETELGKSVVGQGFAVQKISDIVRRGRMGLRNPNKPTGSFLFLGPSGVGKTELSKTLAKTVYGSERSFTRIDMSEFGEQHTVQRLIGAPPGYVGFEAGGQLTNAISQQPYSLLLLDEIEKAHSKIFDIFLQVLDDGRLTDGQGKTVNFSNAIVIATSNLGINEIAEQARGGGDVNDSAFIEKQLMPILLKNFRTEFLNRFDGIVVFNPLCLDDLVKIARLEIEKIEKRTAEHNIKFNIDEQILREKIQQIMDLRFGARPVKRFVEQTCESLIAAKLLGP